MKTCPKCNSPIDEDMMLCPTCGEHLRTYSEKTKFDKQSVLLLRFLVILSAILPPIGVLLGFILRKRYSLIAKVCLRYALTGFAIYCMLTLLALISYLAMTFLGVSYI